MAASLRSAPAFRRIRPVVAVVALAAGALAAGRAASAQGVHLALVPTAYAVAPGSWDTIYVKVTEPGAAFNAFDFVVEYPPALVSCVQMSPLSTQIGPLISSACGSSFHRFTTAADSASASETMLCANTSVTGPGTIYALRFLAGPGSGLAHVRFRSVHVASGGLYVQPVVTADTSLWVGSTADVPRPAPPAWNLGAAPNPSREGVTFSITLPAGARARLDVYDAAGRRVRTLSRDARAGGARVRWDGRDDAGRALAPGVYRAVLGGDGGRAEREITLVR